MHRRIWTSPYTFLLPKGNKHPSLKYKVMELLKTRRTLIQVTTNELKAKELLYLSKYFNKLNILRLMMHNKRLNRGSLSWEWTPTWTSTSKELLSSSITTQETHKSLKTKKKLGFYFESWRPRNEQTLILTFLKKDPRLTTWYSSSRLCPYWMTWPCHDSFLHAPRLKVFPKTLCSNYIIH